MDSLPKGADRGWQIERGGGFVRSTSNTFSSDTNAASTAYQCIQQRTEDLARGSNSEV